MRVLTALGDGGGELSLTALAAATSMPPAKVHRYLVSLIRTGFVEQRPYDGHYALSAQSLRIGLIALARLEIMEVGAAVLYQLRERTDLCTTLSVWGTSGPTIVRKLETSRPVIVNTRVGSNVPLLRSAAGQIFGAFLPELKTAPLLARELRDPDSRRDDTPRTASDARRFFAAVRERGLSRVRGHMLAGVTGFGAPVFDAEGELVAALTVLGPSGSFDDALDGDVAGALRAATANFSARLGYLKTAR